MTVYTLKSITSDGQTTRSMTTDWDLATAITNRSIELKIGGVLISDTPAAEMPCWPTLRYTVTCINALGQMVRSDTSRRELAQAVAETAAAIGYTAIVVADSSNS